MILDALGSALISVAEFVVGLMPDGEPIGLSGFSGIWYGYGWLNSWLPLTEVLAGFGIWLAFHAALYAFLAVVTVYRLLPFKFT